MIGRMCHTDLCFQPPERQRMIIAIPRAAAVNEIVHQKTSTPHRSADHHASGMRSAVSAVDVSIGGTVCPAPPSAPSSTTSAQLASWEIDAIRKYFVAS